MALAPVTEQTAREDADALIAVARRFDLVDDELAQLIAATILVAAGQLQSWQFSGRIHDVRLTAEHRKAAAGT